MAKRKPLDQAPLSAPDPRLTYDEVYTTRPPANVCLFNAPHDLMFCGACPSHIRARCQLSAYRPVNISAGLSFYGKTGQPLRETVRVDGTLPDPVADATTPADLVNPDTGRAVRVISLERWRITHPDAVVQRLDHEYEETMQRCQQVPDIRRH